MEHLNLILISVWLALMVAGTLVALVLSFICWRKEKRTTDEAERLAYHNTRMSYTLVLVAFAVGTAISLGELLKYL